MLTNGTQVAVYLYIACSKLSKNKAVKDISH